MLNVLLLMGVSFLPFPTAVLADYIQDEEHRRVATIFYAGAYTIIAIFFNAFWLYASFGRRLIDEHVSDARLLSRTRRYLLGPLLYGAGIPLAFVSPWLTLGLYVLLSLLYLLPLNE